MVHMWLPFVASQPSQCIYKPRAPAMTRGEWAHRLAPANFVSAYMTIIQGTRGAIAAATLFLACTVAQAAATYTFKAGDGLGGSVSIGYAVNKAGIVVGTAVRPEDPDLPMELTRPTRWTSLTPTDLGSIGAGPHGHAYGINDSGLIAGTSYLPDSGGTRATLWSAATMTNLGTLGGTTSYAYAINNAGVVVGSSTTKGNTRTRATVWQGGRIKALTDLGGRSSAAKAISSNGFVAGHAEALDGSRHAVVWNKSGALTDLGTGWNWEYGDAAGVNAAGTVVGTTVMSGGQTRAVKWVGTTITDLGTLGGAASYANGVNDAGDVVGASSVSGCCGYHATLWRNDVAIDLNGLVDQAVRDAGWVLVEAKAINRAGYITGVARNTIRNVDRVFLLMPAR